MRKLLIGFALSVAFGSAALASDYIVVSSSEPAIKRGQALDAGAKVALGVLPILILMPTIRMGWSTLLQPIPMF